MPMNTDKAFCLEQAAACGKFAASAALANERDKFLLAQAAWTDLANGDALRAQRQIWLGGLEAR